MNKLKLIILVSFILSLIQNSSYAQIWTNLDFEGATHHAAQKPYLAKGSYYYFADDGQRFYTFTQGDFNSITPSITYGGSKAAGFWVKADTPGNDGLGEDDRERSELILSAAPHPEWNAVYSLKFKKVRHIGLAFYIHKKTDLAAGQTVVILQAVQHGDYVGPVPFTVWLRSISPDSEYMRIFTEVTGSDGKPKRSREVTIKKEQWHKLVVKLKPSYSGDLGYAGVKVDDQFIYEVNKYWGYKPSTGGAEDNWRISTGIYRPGAGAGNVVLFMDNIKTASSWEEADPDYKF